MAEPSGIALPAASPITGMAGGRPANPLRERLKKAKREAVEQAMGKSETWVRSILNDEAGVRLDDIPALAASVGLKLVSVEKVCVDPELAHAYETIVAHATQARRLLEEDAE